jgi:hypothetical protein
VGNETTSDTSAPTSWATVSRYSATLNRRTRRGVTAHEGGLTVAGSGGAEFDDEGSPTWPVHESASAESPAKQSQGAMRVFQPGIATASLWPNPTVVKQLVATGMFDRC